MLTLYGCARSRASRNIWLLGELDRPYRHVPVVQRYRLTDEQAARVLNTESPDFRAVTPLGAIPALSDGDRVLTESMAINLYLAEGSALGPRDAAERAQMVEAALFATSWIEPDALTIMFAVADGKGDTAPVAEAAARLRRPLAVVEAKIAADGHPVGRRFTVADINLAEALRYAQSHPTLLGEFSALSGWLAECQARPVFRAMWAQREAEVLG